MLGLSTSLVDLVRAGEAEAETRLRKTSRVKRMSYERIAELFSVSRDNLISMKRLFFLFLDG